MMSHIAFTLLVLQWIAFGLMWWFSGPPPSILVPFAVLVMTVSTLLYLLIIFGVLQG